VEETGKVPITHNLASEKGLQQAISLTRKWITTDVRMNLRRKNHFTVATNHRIDHLREMIHAVIHAKITEEIQTVTGMLDMKEGTGTTEVPDTKETAIPMIEVTPVITDLIPEIATIEEVPVMTGQTQEIAMKDEVLVMTDRTPETVPATTEVLADHSKEEALVQVPTNVQGLKNRTAKMESLIFNHSVADHPENLSRKIISLDLSSLLNVNRFIAQKIFLRMFLSV